MIRRFLTILVLIFAAGCGHLDYTVAKKSEIDRQIVAARVETENKLSMLNGQETGLLRRTIAEMQGREQSAADYLFKGLAVAGGLKTPSRPEMVMGQSINQTATQLPPASAGAQAKAFIDLKTELDETKVGNDSLKAQYETELGNARAQAVVKDKAIADLTTSLKHIDEARLDVLDKSRKTEATLSDARDAAQKDALAEKQRALDNGAHNEKLKIWLVSILLSAAAACAVGAAFVPIPALKSKLIIGVAICGGAALAIPFIQPWFVMAAVGGYLLLVVTWVIINYHHEHSDATDTYRALNEAKQKAPKQFKAVDEILKTWQNGSTTQRIDARLKQVGDT